MLDRGSEELCSLEEMSLHYVVLGTCNFIISAFLHQKQFQFQGMLEHVWSEPGHDYGENYCCTVRKTLNGWLKKKILSFYVNWTEEEKSCSSVFYAFSFYFAC